MANDSQSGPSQTGTFSARTMWMAFALFPFAGAVGYFTADWANGLPVNARATYVGRNSCVECHQPQDKLFSGSHHDKAMALATEETVLGDFNNAELEHHGITSRMFRRGDKFMIHTEGPDGELADFEIKYVFGVDPLQQYMVEFDRKAEAPAEEVSRVQVLRVSWDTHKKRWFHLDPPDVSSKLKPDDPLHWTGVAQRWNTTCADCHSTNLKRGFDADTGHFHTTFSEINVSCEACHGPGSLHVELASATSPFWDRNYGKAIAAFKDKPNVAEVESCAPCHSRRRIVHPDFSAGSPFHDFYAADPLHETAYHADGAIRDEVYEYGSFIQSKMFHKNVKCSDCHDPHSAKLKHEGNKLCTSCHQHPAGKYDSPAHHHHAPNTAGSSCVECHMPTTTYMDVDARRDHGLRVPRPDLSLKFGTPNACTACHLQDAKEVPESTRASLKQYADWLTRRTDDPTIDAALNKIDRYCADGLAKWYPPQKRKEDAIVPTISAARKHDPKSAPDLLELAREKEIPAIFRATALMELEPFARVRESSRDKLISLTKDRSPQVRALAAANLNGLPPSELRDALTPLLSDPVRFVRIEAARVLAPLRASEMHGHENGAFDDAIKEFFAGHQDTADLVSSQLAMGDMYATLNELDEAEKCYRAAIRIEPNAVGPRSHLAGLYDRRIAQAQLESRQAMRMKDQQTAVAIMEPVGGYQILAEQLRRDELPLLARDVGLLPKSGTLHYRYGLALYLADRVEEAEKELVEAARLEPTDGTILVAVALLLEKRGKPDAALEYAVAALELDPEDRGYQETVERIKGK